MEDPAKQPGPGPYQLSEALGYLTPPPSWWTAREGRQRSQTAQLVSCPGPPTDPTAEAAALNDHLESVRRMHDDDLRNGLGRAPLPDALKRKDPNADRQWGWQFVFPASSHYTDARTGIQHRHHLHESVPQKRMAQAVPTVYLSTPAGAPTTLPAPRLRPTAAAA